MNEFDLCPTCNGRLFPGAKSCPVCGWEAGGWNWQKPLFRVGLGLIVMACILFCGLGTFSSNDVGLPIVAAVYEGVGGLALFGLILVLAGAENR